MHALRTPCRNVENGWGQAPVFLWQHRAHPCSIDTHPAQQRHSPVAASRLTRAASTLTLRTNDAHPVQHRYSPVAASTLNRAATTLTLAQHRDSPCATSTLTPSSNDTHPVQHRRSHVQQRHAACAASVLTPVATTHTLTSSTLPRAAARHSRVGMRHLSGFRNCTLPSPLRQPKLRGATSNIARSRRWRPSAVWACWIAHSPVPARESSYLLLPRASEVCTRLGQTSTGRVCAWPKRPAGGRSHLSTSRGRHLRL